MKRRVGMPIITLAVVIFGLLCVLYWSHSNGRVSISTPQVGAEVGIRFNVAGEIPLNWVEGPGIGLDIVSEKDGNILSKVIFMQRVPWWYQFFHSTISFHDVVDTSGITTDTPTCFGAAKIIVGSLYTDTKARSYSLPIVCKPE